MKSKSVLGILLLIIFFIFPTFAMSKGSEENKALEWNISTKAKIFDRIDSLMESKNVIEEKDAFNLQSLDGRFEGDGEAIEYANKVISYDKSTPSALIEALYVLRYWKNLLIDPKSESDKNILKLNGKYPVYENDIALYKRLKTQVIDSINKLMFKSNCPFVKLSVIETLYALNGKEKYNNEIEAILLYYTRETDEESWDLAATPFSDIIAKRNYIKITALRLLFKYDVFKASEISEEILKNYVPNESVKVKRYQNYYEEVKKVILENQKNNNKDKTPNNSKDTGSIYNHIWNPDSSASYCKEFWGPDSSDYNNTEYKSWAYLNSDCANFASQCLIAGGIDLSKATTNAVNTHPCGETTIINCDALNNFIVESRTDFKTFSNTNSSTTLPNWLRSGDIAIVGSPVDVYKHSIICHPDSNTSSILKFGCHTTNHINYPLSNWVNGTYADRVTFYHVIGSTVLEGPSQDSLIVPICDTLNLRALVTNNTEPTSLNPITNFKFVLKKKPENTVETLWETTNAPPSADSTYVFDFETALQDTGRYILYANTTYSTGSTQDSCIVKIKAYPEIQSPTNNEIIHVRYSPKGTVQDTVAIKVKVPEVLSSYPTIKIKIDDVYVNQGDITFDSGENVWIYNWDVTSINPGSAGKRFLVVAEINGTPSCYDAAGVYLVEAILFENFENFTFGEWTEWGGEWPLNSNEPWYIGNSPTISGEKSLSSTTGYTTFSNYFVLSPNVTIPDSSLNKTKLEFDIYWRYSGSLWSNLYMDICDSGGTPIVEDILLPKSTSSWWHYNYDLSRFSGQTISIRLNNYHNFNPNYVIFTRYDIDNFLIYAIPDMEGANIDFISGNSAEINEDMSLLIQFNDTSGIGSVTADYSIEEDSNTITLYPVKGTYNYTGLIPARDHECIGSISFRIKDSVGNETVSSGHSIGWAIGGGGLLTAPQNVLMTVVNNSTLTITWDIVDGATGYKVYTSLDPYGSFTEDTTGTFTSSREWQKTFDGNKYFYYVVATNAVKKEEFEIMAKNDSDR
ncbi:MAG: amidase domain-containing protein [Candidatus Delongbacteria bacterium]